MVSQQLPSPVNVPLSFWAILATGHTLLFLSKKYGATTLRNEAMYTDSSEIGSAVNIAIFKNYIYVVLLYVVED